MGTISANVADAVVDMIDKMVESHNRATTDPKDKISRSQTVAHLLDRALKQTADGPGMADLERLATLTRDRDELQAQVDDLRTRIEAHVERAAAATNAYTLLDRDHREISAHLVAATMKIDHMTQLLDERSQYIAQYGEHLNVLQNKIIPLLQEPATRAVPAPEVYQMPAAKPGVIAAIRGAFHRS